MMLKAVLFDLDDTLFDHRHSCRTALTSLQSHYADALRAISLDELELSHHKILNEVHIEVLSGAISIEQAREKRFAQLLAGYNITASQEEQWGIRSMYRASYQPSRRAAPGAIPLLRALRERQLKIGVLSNNLVEEQRGKLDSCGLTEYVDSLTISEEAGVAKPDQKFFRIALERIGCSAPEVVMIGDSWENDIVPARTLGIRAIWFNAYNLELPDHTLPSIISFEDCSAVLQLVLNKIAFLT